MLSLTTSSSDHVIFPRVCVCVLEYKNCVRIILWFFCQWLLAEHLASQELPCQVESR